MKKHILMNGGATPRMLNQLGHHFELHIGWEIPDLTTWLSEHGAKIEAVSSFGASKVTAAMIDAMPNLKIIGNYGVGYDGVDVKRAVERGIVVTNTPNVLNNDVANTAILLMLAVSRCLVRDDRWVRSGNWKAKGDAPLTRSIEGKTVGILGLGRIGETIARKLEAFSCEVVYHSRNEKPGVKWRYFGDLAAMAKAVDYLVVITPGGAATKHLVNRSVIDALGPEGTLINVARGSVVDEKEVVRALADGRLGWAGLDVFESEPNVPEELFAMDNVVLLPHVGSATVETRQAMGDLVVENITRFFENGKVVTPVPECVAIAKT